MKSATNTITTQKEKTIKAISDYIKYLQSQDEVPVVEAAFRAVDTCGNGAWEDELNYMERYLLSLLTLMTKPKVVKLLRDDHDYQGLCCTGGERLKKLMEFTRHLKGRLASAELALYNISVNDTHSNSDALLHLEEEKYIKKLKLARYEEALENNNNHYLLNEVIKLKTTLQ